MKVFKFGKCTVSSSGPCTVIAEIGHNHQGNLETALKMVKVAAECGVQVVKFQKRDNRKLYTKALYNRPYDNENSYGATYGEHREFLEFGRDEYRELKKCTEENGLEFMATSFDFESVDFLEDLGVTSYKIASGDVTNTPLLVHIAKLGKPMFVSTGAATMDEVHKAYESILKYNDKLCLLHCTAGYPTEYEDLNLLVIKTFLREFPEAIIGYSGHDNGILASVVAYTIGAAVIEKHFTLCHAWKGTDHKFSLEPEGLRKQVRDIRRVDVSLGNGIKEFKPFEKDARAKMGKGIYAARSLPAGTVLTMADVCFKSPAHSTPPYLIDKILGKKLKVSLTEEDPISPDQVE